MSFVPRFDKQEFIAQYLKDVAQPEYRDDFDWDAVFNDLLDSGYIEFLSGANSGYAWSAEYRDMDDFGRDQLVSDVLQKHDLTA